MKSYLEHGYHVNLWTYQPVVNPINHPNFHLRDARYIVPEAEFKSYNITLKKPSRCEKRKALHIANFTDMLRALIIHKVGGWWSDTDSYCINPLPVPDKLDRGVILCSLPTKIEGGRAIRNHLCTDTAKLRKDGIWIWKKWDGRSQFSNSYMYGTKGHPLMLKIAERVKKNFYSHLKYGFIEPMLVTYDVVKEEGYMTSIRPPITFIPLAWWRNKFMYMSNNKLTERKSFGHYIPNYDEIIEKSSCVNFYNGVFKYLHDPKDNMAKQLFNYICKQCDMKIDPETLEVDGFDGNYHAPKEDRKRKRENDNYDEIEVKKLK